MKNEPNTPPNGDDADSHRTAPRLRLWKQCSGKNSGAGSSTPLVQQMPGIHHIELSLRDVDQLFNTMDPSPFHERDLDPDCEEFIVSWARELPPDRPLRVEIRVDRAERKAYKVRYPSPGGPVVLTGF